MNVLPIHHPLKHLLEPAPQAVVACVILDMDQQISLSRRKRFKVGKFA